MITLKLKNKEDRRLRRGHPWAFSNEIEGKLTGIEAGELVLLADHMGKPVGTGYLNPHTLIAFRLLTRGNEEFGPATIRRRILDAKALREKFYPGQTTYRAVFSESDQLPGLVVDRYGSWLVIEALTAGIERLMPQILESLEEAYSPDGIVLRNDSRSRELEGLPLEKTVIKGEYSGPVQVEISGLKLEVDLLEGQKTGFFLDQADNYRLLDGISEGASVLDLFCHTGAWASYAAKAGAASVLGIDASAHALETAKRNAGLNGLANVEFLKEDVFDYLKAAVSEGKRFDLIIADPPAFIKSRAKLAEGLKGYRDLNIKAMKAVAHGGWLISCSCSHHMDRESFREMLRTSAAAAGRVVRLVEERSQSKDHPVLLAAPETEYLKAALLQVL
ncbi:MAG TPA: class I SAM-dependent rRNA methyltransferase [Nitrospirota bacterium]|jgi:23S rRNA (cytosine1962-C5)-methyltransferase